MATHGKPGQRPGSFWRWCGSVLCVLAFCLALPAIKPAGAKAPAPTESRSWDSRSADEREKLLKKYGGTKESEAAVALGLEWLALHQSSNGSWSLDQFHKHAHAMAEPEEKVTTCDCAGQGQHNAIAGTAFGLLPFLGAGYTHQEGKDKVDYFKTVKAALEFLVSKQKVDGDFGGSMYAQGLATIAVCEAYGMSGDPKLKGPAQKAVDFIVSAQHDKGGWRYKPKEAGDTSVTGWQIQALHAGQLAGLKIPKETLEGAGRFLDYVEAKDPDGFGYGYTSPNAITPTMTAAGLLGRICLGCKPTDSCVIASVKTLKNYPPTALHSMYYHFYVMQDMHRADVDNWEGWNSKMRDWLVEKQDKGDDAKHAHQKGSWWSKDDVHGPQGGRIMQTSLALLTLEVYYRYPQESSKTEEK